MNDKQRIEAGAFAENNGAVMRVINIMSGEWKRVSTIQRALSELTPDEFHESLSFLQKAGFVALRSITDRQPVECCDADYNVVAVSLTAQGIRLCKYLITDPAVSV